jgi:hypothetical protein
MSYPLSLLGLGLAGFFLRGSLLRLLGLTVVVTGAGVVVVVVAAEENE